MADYGTPPWLNVQPSDFLRAATEGAAAGTRAEAQRYSEIEAADRLRLAYDTLASHERMQNQQAEAKMALAGQSLAFRQQQAEAADELRRSQMANLAGYREARLGQFQTEDQRRAAGTESLINYRNAMLQQREEALQISRDKAEAAAARGEGEFFSRPDPRGGPDLEFFRQPSGHVMKVIGPAGEPRVQLAPDGTPITITSPLSQLSRLGPMGATAQAAFQPKAAPPSPAAPTGPGFLKRAWDTLTGSEEAPNLPNLIPQPGKRVKVTGPDGQTGTVPEGTELPEGWSYDK